MAGADPGPQLPAHGQGPPPDPVRRHGEVMDFRVRDRNGSASVPVRYTGTGPRTPFASAARSS